MSTQALLNEAKARQAAAQLAKNPMAQKMALQAAQDPRVQQAAMNAASQHYQQQTKNSFSSTSVNSPPPSISNNHTTQQQQPFISPIKSPNSNPNPPVPPSSGQNLFDSNLSPKQIAKLHRENWKVNEQKMNVASTQQITGGGGGGTVAPRWVPNNEKGSCTRCSANFDWAQRRHHCRRCGDVFCGNCSNQKALLPEGTAAKTSDTKNPRRVCYDCFEAVKGMQDELSYSQSNAMRENTIGSKNR